MNPTFSIPTNEHIYFSMDLFHFSLIGISCDISCIGNIVYQVFGTGISFLYGESDVNFETIIMIYIQVKENIHFYILHSDCRMYCIEIKVADGVRLMNKYMYMRNNHFFNAQFSHFG